MKKLFLFLVVALMALSAYSQTESEHMKFMGIPIDGTLDEFKSKLIAKGFVPNPNDKNFLHGTFAGCDNSTIVCYYNKTNNLMYAVGVLFPYSDEWIILSSHYYSLKEMLTQKYGEPKEQKEVFLDPDMAKDDTSKMIQLKLKKADFISTFYNQDKGLILLTILSTEMQCNVSLYYADTINKLKTNYDVMDDL